MICVVGAARPFSQAVEAGATSISRVEDMFLGDRVGNVADPCGYRRSLVQHVRDMSPDEIEEIEEATKKC